MNKRHYNSIMLFTYTGEQDLKRCISDKQCILTALHWMNSGQRNWLSIVLSRPYTENPLHSLIDWTEEDNNFNPEHINRILAGLVEPWKQSDGKDPGITHWHEGDVHRRWNSTQENWVHSKEPDAAEQIGSVFAVQGIDLNKVGVLIGADLEVGNDGKLKANPDNFHNTNGTFTAEEMVDPDNKFELSAWDFGGMILLEDIWSRLWT